MAIRYFSLATLIYILHNTITNAQSDFCVYQSNVHKIDGSYQKLSDEDSINCKSPVWYRTFNGSKYAGDQNLSDTYFILNQSLYSNDAIGGYGFYFCDQMESSFEKKNMLVGSIIL